jgi:hypothetical protein
LTWINWQSRSDNCRKLLDQALARSHGFHAPRFGEAFLWASGLLYLILQNVRYGSGTDISRSGIYVRFTPDNGHRG